MCIHCNTEQPDHTHLWYCQHARIKAAREDTQDQAQLDLLPLTHLLPTPLLLGIPPVMNPFNNVPFWSTDSSDDIGFQQLTSQQQHMPGINLHQTLEQEITTALQYLKDMGIGSATRAFRHIVGNEPFHIDALPGFVWGQPP